MIEPYNMSQAQRDAAHIEALTKQLRDAQSCITALVTNVAHVRVMIAADEFVQNAPADLLAEYARGAAHQAAALILESLAERGELYERLGQYEQWFYAKQNFSTRNDALRSTMMTARP